MENNSPIKFFSGTASVYLAEKIAKSFGSEFPKLVLDNRDYVEYLLGIKDEKEEYELTPERRALKEWIGTPYIPDLGLDFESRNLWDKIGSRQSLLLTLEIGILTYGKIAEQYVLPHRLMERIGKASTGHLGEASALEEFIKEMDLWKSNYYATPFPERSRWFDSQ